MSANSNYTDGSPVLLLIPFPQLDRALSIARRRDVSSEKISVSRGKSRRLLRWESYLDGEAVGHRQSTNQVRITLEAWSPLGPWATSNLTSSP